MLGPQNLNLALPGCSLKKYEENMIGRDVIWWLAVVGGLWMVVMVVNSGGGLWMMVDKYALEAEVSHHTGGSRAESVSGR